MLLLKSFTIFVMLFLKIPNISCEGATLALAIDDTRTMWKYMNEVKKFARTFVTTMLTENSREIQDFVLITINDPDVILRSKTSSPRIFLHNINQIHVHNNELNKDCAENSLAGIEKALHESKPGSYIFVFTDAYAKDHGNVYTVKSLCQKKNSQVIFVLTGDCGNPSDRRYTVYYDIAAACSGQVFRMKRTQVNRVRKPIKLFLERKHSLIKWKTTNTPIKVPFTINETTDYALLSVSGKNATLSFSPITHLYGPEPKAEVILRNEYGMFVKLTNLQPGTYYVYVKGNSDSVTNLMIYVPTPTTFTFDYNFSALEPNATKDTSKQPTAGKQHHLSINVTDPEHLINIQSVQLMDEKGGVVVGMPLKKTDNDFYITDAFVSPTHIFKIKVAGEIKKTSQPITKTSDSIEPSKVVIPEVNIDEGVKVEVDYGARVSLTCKVNAHPPPIIKWLTAGGIELKSESFPIAPLYISYLKLKYIEKQQILFCQATNTEGTRTKQTLVDVRPIFKVEAAPEAKTNAKYGEDLKIQCNIKSYLPIQIKWFRLGKELSNTNVHSISADGSELTLKSMDLEMQGKYTCEASLNSDPTEKQSYETDIKIPGLAPPAIKHTNYKISVKKRDHEIELNCETVRGYPKPQVHWFKKNGNKFDLLPNETSEVLTVPRASLTHAASQYKCVAENVIDRDSANFVVILESEPDVKIDEGAHLYVNYGAGVFLTCRVSAHPPPTIRWFTLGGRSLPYETTVTEEPSYLSYLNLRNIQKNETYVCKSTNSEGTRKEQIKVDVRPVFNVSAVPAANTITKYGEVVKIQCNIKSYLPMKIKWYWSGRELSNNDVHSISADGMELTLKSIDIGKQGKYICEASLYSNPNEKQAYETIVTIPGLAPPAIKHTNYKISVKKRDHEIELNCETIRGYPKPQVHWFKKNGNKFDLLPNETSEVLTVPRASLTHAAGQYKCVAENVIDRDSANFVVILESEPDVKIDEGAHLYVNYGAGVFLTCRVSAHPPPTIRWFTLGGRSLPYETTVTEEPSYLSYLNLRNIQKNETYVCKSTNSEGTRKEQIKVDVRPVFNVSAVPAANTITKYGEVVKIQCNIKSYLPMKIKWYWSGRELSNNDVHSISADGMELTLKSIDIGKQGKYICEASLYSNPNEKQAYETIVTIPGLAPPAIKHTNYKISVKKRDHEIELNCETVRGYPKPQVHWFKKNGNKFDLLPNETSEVLTVPRASLTHAAGQYKCVAENVIDRDSANFVVILESEPDVKIDEGAHLYVNYGAGVFLTCRVSAHPPPTIRWFTLGGRSLPYETTVTEEPSYLSYLNLRNIQKNETYVCKSTNSEGTRKEQIKVDVRPVFNVSAVPAANTICKYGEVVKIQCNIKSYLPMKIKWYWSGKELSNNDVHSISADGMELTLKSMDIGKQGKYICEASLYSNPNEKQAYETIVTIPGLERPVIGLINRNIYVKKTDNGTEINCKTVKGYPNPQVRWFKKNGNKFELLPQYETTEVLTVPRALFRHAGKQTYRCVAENAMGNDSAEFVVIPESEPDVNIDEGVNLNVNYGARVSLTCEVTAHPLPTIEWLTASGISLPSEITVLEEPSYKSQLKLENIRKNETYICKAKNTEGTRTNQIKVGVRPIFDVIRNTPAAPTPAKYGEDIKIQCNIKSYLPINVKWFYSGRELSNITENSISADGLELTLKSMDLGMRGTYTCEASLKSDPTVKQTHETKVTIPGLARPTIESKNKKIHIKKENIIAELDCKAVIGYPKPKVQWFKKNGNKFDLLSHETSEVLTVPRASFTPTGRYKCIAENVMGSDSAEFVVIPESEPDVNIGEGVNLNVNYGADVSLTCKVYAHPPPTIEWLTADGISLTSETTALEEPSYISHLKLSNIKNNGTYICKATNTEGTRTNQTQVEVRPVFNEIAVPAATTSAKYGEDIEIQCNIQSYLPIQVKWFRSGRALSNSTVHSISADGSELTLKSMDLEMEGKYTCEASLNSDPTVKQIHETKVTIPGLEPPVIESKYKKMYIKKGDNEAELSCKTTAYPQPQMQWFKKNGNNFELLSQKNGEVLTVSRASVTHAGQYKCVAENVMGRDSAEFVVIPEGEPDVSIDEGDSVYINYGAEVSLTCKVYAHPPATIEWLTAGGVSMPSESTLIEDPSYVSYLKMQNIKKNETYFCQATNTEGTRANHIHIVVRPIFNVSTAPAANTAANYSEDVKIQCKIKSHLPIKIKWFRSGSELSNTDEHSISADGSELTLKSMDLTMQGKYTCEASLSSDPTEKQTYETEIKIAGLVHPEITYYTTVVNGTNFTAICRVNGVPKPTISWQFKPKGSEEFTTIPGSEEELNIPELNLRDSGIYKCIVTNMLGQTQQDFKLVVQVPPVITNEVNNYLGVEGDLMLQIPCNVSGFPDPTIVWKEGGKTIENDSMYVIKGNVLYIQNPVISDIHHFTCEATNKLGSESATFYTEVLDTFENVENLYGDTHDVYIEQGKPITITCNIVNLDTISVRWYKNGQNINQTGSAYYTIEKATVLDDGNYTCRMNTNYGSKSETFILDVGMAPVLEDDSPSPKIIDWHDADAILDCTAFSKPTEKVEWLHNGKKDASLDDFSQIPVTDWGEYTCIASNVHGSTQKTFKIISSGCYIRKTTTTQNIPLLSDLHTPTWPFSISNIDIALKEHEQIKLSCPNNTISSNAFQMFSNKTEIMAQCQAEDTFIVDGKPYRYKDLQCKRMVESSVINTNKQCLGPQSEMVQVGFAVNGFLEAFKVCYDRTKNVALYARAPINLSPSGRSVDSSAFIWNPAPLGDGKSTGAFTCGTSKKCCYVKDQLLKVDEVAFGPAQAASFTENLNSIAVWNPCGDSNRTSWQDFEKDLKSMSFSYVKWSSWTGASDYVSKNGGLIPRYLWKVMNYDDDSSVMVYVNDESPVGDDIRCTDPCETMLESADKFLYCCSLDEFSRVFGIPSDSFKDSVSGNQYQNQVLESETDNINSTILAPKEV